MSNQDLSRVESVLAGVAPSRRTFLRGFAPRRSTGAAALVVPASSALAAGHGFHGWGKGKGKGKGEGDGRGDGEGKEEARAKAMREGTGGTTSGTGGTGGTSGALPPS